MNNTKISALFTCEISLLAPLFAECEYPWELLPKIKALCEDRAALLGAGLSELRPGVFVGKDVTIHENAVIIPPAVLLDGCEVRPGAYLRGNVFAGRGCVIGNSSELKNCILLDGVQAPHYNYVGDSILGNRSHLGAGSICSNLKAGGGNVVIHGESEQPTGMRKVGAFLGDGADIGCGCVLNPGTVIGKGSSVYPLTPVRGVIPPNHIVKDASRMVERLPRE